MSVKPRHNEMAAPDDEDIRQSLLMDELLQGDYSAFDECVVRATKPSQGYWRPSSTLAWIGTRDDKFLAGTQLYEMERRSNQHGDDGWGVWLVVRRKLEMATGQSAESVERDLRDALESGAIPGATAVSRNTGLRVTVGREHWPEWRPSFESWGHALLPGHFDFQFPANEIQAEFPARERSHQSSLDSLLNAPTDSKSTLTVEEWADGAVERRVTVQMARFDALEVLGDSAPPQDESRVALKQARARVGIETKKGRPSGAKSFGKLK